MKHAVIDIGSNSMRLTVYSVEKESFTVLFKEKIMAGLANYMEHGILTEEGIRRAGAGLLSVPDGGADQRPGRVLRLYGGRASQHGAAGLEL